MKFVEQLIAGNTANGTDVGDLTQQNYITVFLKHDGYQHIFSEPIKYIIVAQDSDYGIYRLHLTKDEAEGEAVIVDNYFRDEHPVVFTLNGNLYFTKRDSINMYLLADELNSISLQNKDIKASLLNAFVAYAKSKFDFGGSYDGLITYPILIGASDDVDIPPLSDYDTPVVPEKIPAPADVEVTATADGATVTAD